VIAIRSNAVRLLRFGLVGGAATMTYAVLVGLLHRAGLVPAAASMTAYLTAGLVSYLGHKRITFRSDRAHAVAAPRFVASLALGIGTAGAIPVIVVDGLRLPLAVATAVTCVAAPVLSYLALSLFVFGVRSAAAADRHTAGDTAHVAPHGPQTRGHAGVAAAQDGAGGEVGQGGDDHRLAHIEAAPSRQQGVEA